jgi:hypothetical protein
MAVNIIHPLLDGIGRGDPSDELHNFCGRVTNKATQSNQLQNFYRKYNLV